MDSTTVLLLVAVVLVVLKPDLLDSILGKRTTVPPGYPGGVPPYPVLQPPPAAGGAPSPNSPAQPIRAPGDTTPPWIPFDPNAGAAAAFDREHPCPPGQSWNTISGKCQDVILAGNTGGAHWYGVPPPTQTPPPPPQTPPTPPNAIDEGKASNRRSAQFTPFS
jgi:hypothetical protein